MEHDEDGPVFPEPAALNLPNIAGETIIVGANIRRLENGAYSPRGLKVPCIELTMQTTEGPIRTFWTRDEAAAFAHGLLDVTCDA